MGANDVSPQQSIAVNSRNDDMDTNNSNLPEGFFDDPVQDAKVRYQKIFDTGIMTNTDSIRTLDDILMPYYILQGS